MLSLSLNFEEAFPKIRATLQMFLVFQGSEKEEREEWKERRAGHGRGLNNFTGSSPGNQRPTKKDAEE